MRRCAEAPEIADGLARLLSSHQDSGTVSSFYLGFKSLLLRQHDDWALSIVHIQAAPDVISAPAGDSAALCIRSHAPLEFDIYIDDAEYDPVDVRPSVPIRRHGVHIVRPGDVIALTGRREWMVPRGEIDAIFLKIDGPPQQPVSTAFDRATLLPLHAAFADQDHTAKDFFAALLGSLLLPGEIALASVAAEERAALVDFLAGAADEEGVHLVTRWKYLQALSRLDSARAVEPLTRIAETSRSVIGDKARAILAAHRTGAGAPPHVSPPHASLAEAGRRG